ncbi:hypothetical protein [Nocardia alba]|uniref:Uncharacterized protein n=1 Tax=Nocardia alba TaxID=225051 RepID=A0A4R1G926_9NOCA|nr:hypothetical protein [Nocardia alba]TCK00552.1 hypothetical protein DFR71_1555 [Nocardia alba]
MGSYRKATKAELRRREVDQRDPAWLAWLAEMDPALETFFAEDVTDMPSDPFSADGVATAELAAIARFSSVEAVLAPENAAAADRFQRYFGEAFVRSFEGRWMNVRVAASASLDVFFDRRGCSPVVRCPFAEFYVDTLSQLLGAVHYRNGEEWTWVYGHSVNDYAEWQVGGRLPMDKWISLQAKKARREA